MLPNGFPPAGDGRRGSSAPPPKELISISPVAIPWLVSLSVPSRSLFTLVTDSLTDWLTNSLLFSRLYWCDHGVWRCQVKTYWDYNWSWCWCREIGWRQFGGDLEAEVWSQSKIFVRTLITRFWGFESRFWSWSSGKILKLRFGQYFAANSWLRLWSWILVDWRFWSLSLVGRWCLVEILKLMFCRDSEDEIWSIFVKYSRTCNMT